MNNPYHALLKTDSRTSFLTSFIVVSIIIAVYYLFSRESFVFVLLTFIVSGLYIMSFLQAVEKKLHLYFSIPATTQQLVSSLYATTFRSMTILVVLVFPFFILASQFDEVQVSAQENMMLYVAIIGNIFLYISAFIWLFFEVQVRSYVSLAQFASIFIVTFLTFSIMMTFERINLNIYAQLILFAVLYACIIWGIYRRTRTAALKFNVN